MQIILERFTKKNCKRQIKQSLELIKKRSNELYVKYKGYNNSFNSWIDERDIVM